MNKRLAQLAIVSCLTCPALAAAHNGTPATTFTDTDVFSFTLSTLSSASIDYTWSDTLRTQTELTFSPYFPWVGSTTKTTEYDAKSLGWTLTGPTSLSGTFSDLAGVTSGKGTLSLGELSAGSYTLTLSGSWAKVNGHGVTEGSVNLLDGDRIGCRTEINTFSTAAVAAPVPEPETYAMLVAGLGLMGFVARRRSKA